MLSGTAGHPAGKITPRAGASLSGGVFHFPAAHAGSMINTATKTGRINFVGNVNFYKYNGIQYDYFESIIGNTGAKHRLFRSISFFNRYEW